MKHPAAGQERPGRLGTAAGPGAAGGGRCAGSRRRAGPLGGLRPARIPGRHRACRGARPDRQCRRPHRGGQGRERARTRPGHQRPGARRARPGSRRPAARCWCITPPTTCSTAAATRFVPRTLPLARSAVYGVTKLEGEELIRAEWLPPPDLPHQLGVCRPGRQLRQDHAAAWLPSGDALTVIDDQFGAPTGADLLADVTAHAARMPP